jgi:hypothetical protein
MSGLLPFSTFNHTTDDVKSRSHNCFCDQSKAAGPVSKPPSFTALEVTQPSRQSARLGVSLREALGGAWDWGAIKSRSFLHSCCGSTRGSQLAYPLSNLKRTPCFLCSPIQLTNQQQITDNTPKMIRNAISTLAVIIATALAEPAPELPIVTDPAKIIQSITYDLGERLLTVQELTKEALPMPPVLPPVVQAPATPYRSPFRLQRRASISVGAQIYKRGNQPTRSFLTYHLPGQQQSITFWSSADWSLIAAIGRLTASDGTIWDLFCMPCVFDQDRKTFRQQMMKMPSIPEMPAGASTWQIVSGNPTPEQMAPIDLYHAYYDAHLPELEAVQRTRLAEHQRLAAEALANPPEKKDITVQYRTLSPEEIVAPATTTATQK